MTGAYLGSQSHQLTALKQTPTPETSSETPSVIHISFKIQNVQPNVNPEFPKYYGNSLSFKYQFWMLTCNELLTVLEFDGEINIELEIFHNIKA